MNKPAGWTSHDVVLKIRRITGQSKVGHTGTLDPLATGVLLVCLGKATKIAQYLTHEEKEYVATLTLGVTTDTFDADGTVLKTRKVDVDLQGVKNALVSFQGELEQIPPMFSAVKHAGKKLYELARSGKTVDRAPRRVHIFDLELIAYDNHDVTLRVRCSKGTYIRSLAADIGEKLGCGAHIIALQRTKVGRFGLDTALTIEDVERLAVTGLLQKQMLSIYDALNSFPEIRVGVEEKKRIATGASVVCKDVFNVRKCEEGHQTIRIVGSDNTFLGMGIIEYSESRGQCDLRPIRVLI